MVGCKRREVTSNTPINLISRFGANYIYGLNILKTKNRILIIFRINFKSFKRQNLK